MSAKESGPPQRSSPPIELPTAVVDGANASLNGEIVRENASEDLVKLGIERHKAEKAVEIVTSYHQGPLPSPKSFGAYEEICPGAARDILEMAKAEQRHDHFIEKAYLLGEIGLKFTTIIAAVCSIAFMIGGAVYAALQGHDQLAYTIAAGGGISILVATWLKPAFEKKAEQPPASASKKKPSRKKAGR